MLRLTRSMITVSLPAPAVDRSSPARGAEDETGARGAPRFADVYEEHFDFVWRSARRLGVDEVAAEDLVQEIFVLIHRQLPTFEGRSALRTWIYGFVLRVVREHRRVAFRAAARRGYVDEGASLRLPDLRKGPDEQVALAQAGRVVESALDEMPPEQREVFVMVELEQLTIPEIAHLTGEKKNTVYSRLRLAREAFERSATRHRARDRWGAK